MSGFYRKKTNALVVLLKDKGFYIILSLSLVMVMFAAFVALSWDPSPETTEPEVVYEEPLAPDYVPDWEEEILTEDVALPQNDITVTVPEDNAPVDEEAVETPAVVVFSMPVDESLVVSVNDFSGSMPVFSETLGDWRLHKGVDYLTAEPCDVYAAADGIVEDVYEDGFMGTTVLLLHADGTRTVYQSLTPNVKVIKGMEVLSGDILGKTGESAENEILEGCHLHFEMIKNGAHTEPVFGE